MRNSTLIRSVLWTLAVAPLVGCGGSSGNDAPAPLSSQNINLIFVLSPDLTYAAPGDVNPATANLTNQGLNRSLQMASFLKTQVLGNQNVNGIYAVAPMTHQQTANNLPDMAAIGAIQQFAMLLRNKITDPGFQAPAATGVITKPSIVARRLSAATLRASCCSS